MTPHSRAGPDPGARGVPLSGSRASLTISESRELSTSSHSLPEVQPALTAASRLPRGCERDADFPMDDSQHAMSDSEGNTGP